MEEIEDAGSVARDLKRNTGKKYPAEGEIRVVSEGLEAETGSPVFCRQEGTIPKDHGI